MGRSAIPPALLELSTPTSPEAQVEALRNLKNEIVEQMRHVGAWGCKLVVPIPTVPVIDPGDFEL